MNSIDNKQKRGNLDLVIARLPGLNAREKGALCRICETEEDLAARPVSAIIAEADKQFELDLGQINREQRAANIDKARREAEHDRAVMEARNIKSISIAESAYPPLLREIFDPPAVLFYKGELCRKAPALAIVGTRKPCSSSSEFCYTIAREIAGAGVSIISGLALGIDAMAHRGAVDSGGKTIAVLGSAVDYVHPASNKTLAARILERGGAIVSEYPPGTPPARWHFPARNRIISGLSQAVLVACAPKKSGALITADFALDQGRDLYAAVREDGSGYGEGCERLIMDGAKSIRSARDLFDEWKLSPPPLMPETTLAQALARELGLS
ncbi:MAG: DNA-processing protein DprA [Spirochaetaceae bacterium]|jgi:DNA processing protein|nr:DNA-processing protein DprA [Spirochaetaceae bacterium]